MNKKRSDPNYFTHLAIIILLAFMSLSCTSLQTIGSKNDAVITLKSSLFSNVYLLKAEIGYVMVDAGNHDQDEEILKQLETLDIMPKEIKLIIITHAHGDHYGGLAQLKRISGADVLSHRGTAKYLKAGSSRPPIPITTWGSFIAAIHPEHITEKVKPDIIVEDEYDLTNYGLRGKIIHTPGHTPDSISIILDGGQILVGDMFTGEAGDLSFGMFCEDETTLKESIQRVESYKPKTIYLSHSETISGKALTAFVNEF